MYHRAGDDHLLLVREQVKSIVTRESDLGQVEVDEVGVDNTIHGARGAAILIEDSTLCPEKSSILDAVDADEESRSVTCWESDNSEKAKI